MLPMVAQQKVHLLFIGDFVSDGSKVCTNTEKQGLLVCICFNKIKWHSTHLHLETVSLKAQEVLERCLQFFKS